jgi:hypothetical protein
MSVPNSKVCTHAAFATLLLTESTKATKLDKQGAIEQLCDYVVGICKEDDSVRSGEGVCTLMYSAILHIGAYPEAENLIAKSLSMLRWLVSGQPPETLNTRNAVYLLNHIPMISTVMAKFSESECVMQYAIELVFLLLRCAECREPIYDSGIITTIIDMVQNKLVCTNACFSYCLAAIRNVSLLEKSRPVLLKTVIPFLLENLGKPNRFQESDMQHVMPIITNSCLAKSCEEDYLESVWERGLELLVAYGVEHVHQENTIRSVITFCRNYIVLRCDVTIRAEAITLIWTLLKAVIDNDSKPSEDSIKQIASCILAKKNMWSVDQLEHAFSFLLSDHVIRMCSKTNTIRVVLSAIMHRAPECSAYLKQSAVIDRLYQLTDEYPMSIPIVLIVHVILSDVTDNILKECTGPIEPMDDRQIELTKKASFFVMISELLKTTLQD